MKEKTSLFPGLDRGALLLFAGVFLAASFFLFFRLGDRAFRNPDEGRYAEVAREMVRSGDWTKPTLYGVGYLRKPVLFYWLIAASFRTFGENEWSARLVPALAGLLALAAVFWFSLRFFGPGTALFASTILASNLWYLQVSRYLVIDAVFTLFILGCLFSFYSALHSAKRKDLWFGCFYACLAAAFLAKGLVAIAIPAVSIGAYLVSTGQLLKTLRQKRLYFGIPIFILLAGPWYLSMEIREPGFLKFFFGHEHWMRLVSADFEHQEPWFYYLGAFPLLLFPWVLFWRPLRRIFAGSGKETSDDTARFLAMSVAATLVFFSLSRSKMPTYILPCVPLAAILLARGWTRWLRSRPVLGRQENAVLMLWAVLALGLMIVPVWIFERHPNKYPDAALSDLKILGGGLLAGTVFCWRSIRRGRTTGFFYSAAAAMGLVSILFTFTMETMNRQYSTKAFALYLKDKVSAGDEIFIYDHPGPFYDFAFYLGRDVKLVGLEGELEFSRHDPRVQKVSLSREAFTELLRRDERFYCLIRRSDFKDLEERSGLKLNVLMEDTRKVLFYSGRSMETRP